MRITTQKSLYARKRRNKLNLPVKEIKESTYTICYPVGWNVVIVIIK